MQGWKVTHILCYFKIYIYLKTLVSSDFSDLDKKTREHQSENREELNVLTGLFLHSFLNYIYKKRKMYQFIKINQKPKFALSMCLKGQFTHNRYVYIPSQPSWDLMFL